MALAGEALSADKFVCSIRTVIRDIFCVWEQRTSVEEFDSMIIAGTI